MNSKYSLNSNESQVKGPASSALQENLETYNLPYETVGNITQAHCETLVSQIHKQTNIVLALHWAHWLSGDSYILQK